MADEQLPEHLQRLGLPAAETEMYLLLLDKGPMSHQALADELGLTAEQVAEQVESLTRFGMVGMTNVDDVAPIEPTTGLQRLARAREAEVKAAELAAANAYRVYRRTVWQQSPDDLVEVISAPHIAERVQLEEAAATTEVLRFDSPPYSTQRGPNDIEVENLKRGVRYRCVYARAAVQQPDYYAQNIQPCIAAGEQARVLPEVPVKLSIFDGQVAMVALTDSNAEISRSSLVIRQSSLLDALIGLFETSWRSALPMHLGTKEPSSLRPIERKIIELLASGITDNAIAELLGISRRTLSRNLENLTTRAGVVNRFQLAVYACRNGWI
ncbi:helix-turn-helix transcriptional regulator [Thermocrispum municipale]|jgi:DNA-binding CsgD family transcriptional regulator/predicted DNA-binding transcriptional regulator|uniref:helix-turn-helix transcriptional regulator n=1 Tax=Thermocrispum municipale TaxID=37926 RepID=UPI000414DB41|nr:helix-turn-helix transcriptional regulator [Thermocrispum municipale]